MAISLQKGQNVSLSKESPGLKKIRVGLGWDARVTTGQDFDLDASAFLLGADGKCRTPTDFIFFNNKQSSDGSVVHQGDNLTGEGEGDDEVININLDKVPADVERVAITVTIYDSKARGQNFGGVENAFARIVNDENESEVARYDLTEDYSVEDAMIFAEIYRHNGEWKFKAIGQGFDNGLKGLTDKFGIDAN